MLTDISTKTAFLTHKNIVGLDIMALALDRDLFTVALTNIRTLGGWKGRSASTSERQGALALSAGSRRFVA